MPIDPGFGQVTYHHSATAAAGDLAVVVGFDPASATLAIAQAVRDQWQSHALDAISSGVTFTGATVRFGQDGADDLVFDLAPNGALPLTGAFVGSLAPLQVAALVRKLTGLGGRRNRGRMYLPGVPEAQINDDSRMTTAYFDAVVTAMNDYNTNMGLVPAPLVILHPARPSYFRRDGTQVPALPAAPPTPVTSLQVESLVATQRRRIR